MYKLTGVSRDYRTGRRTVHALRGVNLTIEDGDWLAIQGPTGHGKSTLLQLLGGLDRPTSGTIELDGRSLAALPEGQLTRVRASTIGFIFQTFNLIPTLTAQENVETALVPLGIEPAARRERARQALAEVSLGDRARHLPSELSGGQQQRVAIARALVKRPRVLLADEPTGNLDEGTRDEIMELLAQLWREHNLTLVIVTHDTTVARRAQKLGLMREGLLEVRPAAGSGGSGPDERPEAHVRFENGSGPASADEPARFAARRLQLPGSLRLGSRRHRAGAVAALAVAAIGIAGCASAASPAAASSPAAPAAAGAAAGSGSHARSGPEPGGTVGTVTSLSASAFTVSTPAGGQKVTIKETSSTTYKKGTSSLSAGSITTGQTVLVLGTTDSTTITATQVIVEPGTFTTSSTAATVIPFTSGSAGSSKQTGTIPAAYKQGTGTIVTGSTADKAAEASLAAYPGGVVDRVVKLSNGDYEVHNIGVNWPHHVFVNQDFKVIGAND